MCTAPIYLSYLTWNLWTNHQFFIWTLLDSLPSKLHTNLSSLSRRLRLKMISELSRVWLITWDWCSVLINSFVIPNVRLRDLKGWSFFFGRQRAYTKCLGNLTVCHRIEIKLKIYHKRTDLRAVGRGEVVVGPVQLRLVVTSLESRHSKCPPADKLLYISTFFPVNCNQWKHGAKAKAFLAGEFFCL